MTPLNRAKVALVVAGLACFGYGVRAGAAGLRWAGIGLVAVAWILRFVRRSGGS